MSRGNKKNVISTTNKNTPMHVNPRIPPTLLPLGLLRRSGLRLRRLKGGGFTLLNFAFGEPCEAGIQQGKGEGEGGVKGPVDRTAGLIPPVF